MFRIFFAILLLILAQSVQQQAFAEDKVLDEKAFLDERPGHPLSPFLFDDEKGRTLDIKEFRGRFVLLNLWATFCGPCIAEMSKLDELSGKLNPKVWAVIALAEDHDGLSTAHSFYAHHNIRNLAVFVDSTGRAPFALQMRGLPTTILIDPKGDEIGRLEGAADWSKETMLTFLKTQTGELH